jgi:hypothetical protein
VAFPPPWVMTAGWAYVRFHGPQAQARPYAGDYGAAGWPVLQASSRVG